MAVDRSPTLRGRELGRRLRELRGDRTLQEVADAVGLTSPTISRIETGSRTAAPRTLRDLCDFYEVDASMRAQLQALAREASQQGWWHKYDDLDIDRLIGLEIEAKQISSHEAANIPWAFQTAEYAQAIIKGILPRIDSSVLADRVTARITRQELLRSADPPHFWSLIDESAFHRPVGGNRVMKEQLSKVLEVADAPNVIMQIVPFGAGAHPGLNNSFTLLEFGEPTQPPIVVVENFAGNLYLEREAEIDRYREALEHLSAAALSPTRSARWIEEIRKKFEE
jgi:transcriptional regulator with XRE-family HTH domain